MLGSLRRQRSSVQVGPGAPENVNVSKALQLSGISGRLEHCSFVQQKARTCGQPAYNSRTESVGLFRPLPPIAGEAMVGERYED